MARIIITLTAPLFYFFVFSLLSHLTMSQRQHLQTFCNPSENFTQTSSYETNRDILLASLRENSSLGTYSNATIGISPDTVYGMFLCRGDTRGTTVSCADCVQTATIEIARNCSLNKAAIIYYQKCMVRYSNVSFFNLMEISPRIGLTHSKPAPNLNRFNQTLFDKFDQLILNVSSSSSIPYFVEDQELVTQPEGSYELESMVQCSPDLDLSNCTVCLRFALFRISVCCGSPSIAQGFTPKCILWYRTTVMPSPPSSPSPLSLSPQPSPAQSPPPPSLSQSPSPQFFTPSPNIPSPSGSGSFSVNVIKGNEIFGRIVVTVTALLVLALTDM